MKKAHLLAAAALLLALPPLCHAAEKFAATIDAAEAAQDPDFAIQGEYVADFPEGRIGLQVVALGDGEFDAVVSRGGLPGDGWDGEKPRESTRGKRADDGAVTFRKDEWTAVLRDGAIEATNSEDSSMRLVFEKVERESPTLGAAPPEGALVLFDGSEDTAAKHWEKPVLDGGLLTQGAITSGEFGDFELHLEFLLPWMPKARGQARGNSGLYVAGRYEVQMLDSFGLAGLDNECGGVYKVAAPRENMCFPPLRWQTYDVEFTAPRFDDAGTKTENARLTVRHNGVVVHKDLELPEPTGGARRKGEGPTGPIYLQNHGNPVRYRNIWLVKR